MGLTAQDIFHQQAALLGPFVVTPTPGPPLSTSFHARAVSRPCARPPSPTPAATGVAFLSPTPLADFCNQNRTRAHRANARTPHEADFRLPRCLERFPTLGGEQRVPEAEASRWRHEVTPSRAGREPTSQRARSGAEAPSREPRHPTVATSLPPSLESSASWRSGPGPPPDTPRERLEPLREPRCLPLAASLTGEQFPRDRPAHDRMNEWARTRLGTGTLGTALTCSDLENRRQIATLELGSNQLDHYALRRP
jgi:hypothetical protein